ncbi:hypothetical protein RC74_13505 [Falsihalocynthiibacter arcticus]|uniref:Uncharacterized protein n=1 Tax=Falsihalocynthiibacter arcticus TaxID=1579316 RepID=A0A126V1H6_9RHOB|nr:hypothetical protein RC74_13505 [Falsihalocynthiibacter arcticus]
MCVRLFGGWDFEDDDALRRDFVVVCCSKGGPMGSDLVAATEEGRSPEFWLCIMRPKQDQFNWLG